MTTFTSNWVKTASGKGFRIPLNIYYSVSTNGTTAYLTVELPIQTVGGALADNDTSWSLTGDFTEASPPLAKWAHKSNYQTTVLVRRSKDVALSYTQTQEITVTGRIGSIGGIPGTALVTGTIVLPKRATGNPGPPTQATVSRVDDTTQTLKWTLPAESDSNPVTGVQIDRVDLYSKNGGWYPVARINGRPTTFNDKTTANQRYLYRMRTVNGTYARPGQSAWVQVGPIETTPNPPMGAVSALRRITGSISVGVDYDVPWALIDKTTIQRSSDSGATWATVQTISGNPTSANLWWTDASPGTGLLRYRARVQTKTPILYSAWTYGSKDVPALAAPKAPSALSPNGAGADAARPIALTWTHNPVDTTPQEAFEVRHRLGGTTTWASSGQIASTDSAWAIPAGTYTNGPNVTIEWQVLTKGQSSTWSPASATATIRARTTPLVSILSPKLVVQSAQLTVEWSYFQAEGLSQSYWYARLYDADDRILEELSGFTGIKTATFTAVLSDETPYRVEVAAGSRSIGPIDSQLGLSDPASQTFTTDFLNPAMPGIVAEWVDGSAAVAVTVTGGLTSDDDADTDYIFVERSADGDDWRLIAERLPAEGGAFVDPLPALGGVTHYRAVAVSSLKSVTVTPTATVNSADSDVDRYVWFNAGPGLTQVIRLSYNPTVLDQHSRAKELVGPFDGSIYPQEYAGDARSTVRQIRADFARPGARLPLDPSTRAEIEAFTDLPAPACYRDPDGVREFGSLAHGGFGNRGHEAMRSITLTFTRIGWSEPTRGAL